MQSHGNNPDCSRVLPLQQLAAKIVALAAVCGLIHSCCLPAGKQLLTVVMPDSAGHVPMQASPSLQVLHSQGDAANCRHTTWLYSVSFTPSCLTASPHQSLDKAKKKPHH
jgi:hypothetical protein